jgi:serpin B
MRRRFLGVVLAPVLLLSACGGASEKVQSDDPSATVTRVAPIPAAGTLSTVATGENAFGLDLFRQVAPGAMHDNTAISPVSIANVLGMVLAGSKGETAQQILDALHVTMPAAQLHAAVGGLVRVLALDNSDDVVLQQADRVWIDNGLNVLSSFRAELAREYAAQLGRIDFSDTQAAADAMNAWAAQATHGKITKFIDPQQLDDARLVLANAVYLDAKWAQPFDKSATAPAPFFVTPTGPVDVPTMHETTSLAVAEGGGYAAVALPYAGNKLEMDVIMPNDFASFERSLDPAKLNAIVSSMRTGEVALSLPKFELRASFPNLKQPLEQLGIRAAFGNADLSGIDGQRDLFLSAVVHETFVHVDEEGTVAAAVTGGVMTATAIARPEPIRIDHPFVFVIRDVATGAILFVGHVMNPRAAASV